MKHQKCIIFYGIFILGVISISVNIVNAKQIIHLTLDEAIEVVMGKSYRIKQLQMGIERNRYWLKARQASLKSKVYMNLMAPEYKAVSDYRR